MNGRLRAVLAVAAVGALTLSQGGVVFAQSEEFECEFPAQEIGLIRNVNITNTAPQLSEIETDACGNVLSYTETITRNLSSSNWIPVQSGETDGFGEIAVVESGMIVRPQITLGVVVRTPDSSVQRDESQPQIPETDIARPYLQVSQTDPDFQTLEFDVQEEDQ